MAIHNRILNNVVVNTSGIRPAYIALDTEAFDRDTYRGAGIIDVELSGNVVKPYPANPAANYKGNEISQEGIFPCFLFGPAPAKDPVETVFHNIYYSNNSSGTSRVSGHGTQECVTASSPAAKN